MKIEILGTGCPKCTQLAQVAEESAKDLELDYQLEKVTDINKIMAAGVMMTPALVVDGKVKASGKVLSQDEMKNILQGK